ncbi:hypothetical protein [Polyangium aurulentum]|uniref:hypothetical protein n=1 Tax=Polyangium aurulentum TaxID=2567896 RepID=UPI0010ADAC1F|nr:hypothetical protein [Polyangium aurulentum]UQA59702.1 hypothetical protein E8A73_004135 [Polyangium aurulentum]
MIASRKPIAVALAAGVLVAGARGGAQTTGDGPGLGPEVLHMPTLERKAEQGILRPVPIVVDLPRDVALRARRVLVHYRLWGDPDWTTLELRRAGARYEGAIPCLEISTVTGDLRYYIRVHDAEGRVIATGAARVAPYFVTIKHDTTLDPDQPRVAKCPDPADCPRGLPGCPSERVVEIACKTDADCEGGATCSWRGFCERADRRKNWLSISAQQELGFMSMTGACSIQMQENEGYSCHRADGAQYTGTPVHTNEPLGVGLGPTRLVLGFDRLLFYDTTLGVRVGWAFFGEGPTPREGTAFVPLLVSARATHWFGDDLFKRSGLRPFVFVTGGYAMTDIKAQGHVREDPTAVPYQEDNDLEQTTTVWKRAGDGFAGAGAGLGFAWEARRVAFVELAALGAFPFGAVVIAPSAGVMLGF